MRLELDNFIIEGNFTVSRLGYDKLRSTSVRLAHSDAKTCMICGKPVFGNSKKCRQCLLDHKREYQRVWAKNHKFKRVSVPIPLPEN